MEQDSAMIFKDILDKNEIVIETFKPNKMKMFWSMFLRFILTWVWVALILGFVFGGIFGETTLLEDGAESIELSVVAFFIAVAISLVIFVLLIILFFHLSYAKTYYAYTNKRVLIRHGIIGVDYKSLDKKSIGAITVNVSILDKMVRQNTGTIVFGSMSSPIGQAQVFRFANISNPYEVYKQVKNDIDDAKVDFEKAQEKQGQEEESDEDKTEEPKTEKTTKIKNNKKEMAKKETSENQDSEITEEN